MATVLSLFPSENSASTGSTKKPGEASERTSNKAKLPPYLIKRGGYYYFKRKVPTSLLAEFGNQAQLWISLNTKDFSQACRELAKEVAAFELRVATVRLRMASEGLTVAPVSNVKELSEDMIPALVQRYYVHMLDREDQELRSVQQPLQEAELAERRTDADEMLRYYQLAHAGSQTVRDVLSLKS